MKDFIIFIETSIILGCLVAWLLGYEEWWQWALCIMALCVIIIIGGLLILFLLSLFVYKWYKEQNSSIFSIIKKMLRKFS